MAMKPGNFAVKILIAGINCEKYYPQLRNWACRGTLLIIKSCKENGLILGILA